MHISLIGATGVGKGTQAISLIPEFKLSHLATGVLLRDNMNRHTAISFLAKSYVEQGKLVPDEVVEALVSEWLWNKPKDRDVLFDGFPRTLDQAYYLDNRLGRSDRQLDVAIHMEIPDEVVAERLRGRTICHDCQAPHHDTFNPATKPDRCNLCGGELIKRGDDIQELIRVRLRNFRRIQQPLLDYYDDSNRLYVVDGSRSIEEVGQEIREAINLAASTETQAHQDSTPIINRSRSEGVSMISKQDATHTGFDLILMGGPGSGKGTQAELLKNHLSLTHISTGDLFRENIAEQSDLGILAKQYIDKGELVPDDVTEGMVDERLSRSDVEKGFILDGFPRNLSQAYALTQILNNAHRRIDGAIHIKVSDEEIVERISGRLICKNCQHPFHKTFKPPKVEGVCDLCGGELYQRSDDNAKTVHQRLKTYHSQTTPILDYYRKSGILIEVEGEGELKAVFGRVTSELDKLQGQ